MKKSIVVDYMVEYGTNIEFGIICRNINTGEFLYYTHYDKKGNYKGEKYYRRFHPDNLLESEEVRESFFLSYGSRQNDLDNKLSYFVPIIDDLINKHIEYNRKMNLPLNDILRNKKTLAVIIEIFSDISNNIGQYFIPGNTIELSTGFISFNKECETKKEKYISVLLHELGHMKVSSIKQNKDKSINIDSGYIRTTSNGNRIKSCENDTIIFLEHKNQNYRQVVLEEIINDLECSEISENYKLGHPSYGTFLDKMSNGSLKKARYTEGIDAYYEMFENNYGSISEANELLDLMGESLKVEEYKEELFKIKEYRERSFQLLKKYSVAKKKN